MSSLDGTPDPFYTTDIGARYQIDLSDYLQGSTIVSAVVHVDWSKNQGSWSVPMVSLQADTATVDETGTIITAYLGNGSTPAGYVRIRSTVTTNASPTWVFDDITDPHTGKGD